MRKRTFWHVPRTKTQISLRMRIALSVFIVRKMKLCIFDYPESA